MIAQLQREFDRIFDLKKGMPQEEPLMSVSEADPIAELDFGEVTHVIAMLYQKESRRRLLARDVYYAGERAEAALYASPLPFDGPYHRHNTYELTYVASGRLTYVMSGQEVVLEAGDALLMDRNCVHFDRNMAEDAAVLYLSLPQQTMQRFSVQTGAETRCSRLLQSEQDKVQRFLRYRPAGPGAGTEAEQCLAWIIQEVNLQDYGSREMLTLLACRLLLRLEAHFSGEPIRLTSNLQKDLLLIELDRYLQAHLATVTLRDLVRQFHFNGDYFCRKIKQKYGVTLTEYIQQKRIAQARQLLLRTELPVLEIIEQVGYKNARYFYEIFRKSTGMTPAEYRDRMSGAHVS